MRENGINPTVVRAGKANLFLSEVFTQSFANVNNTAVEFYEGDGSFGAAIGAGIGAGIYKTAETALQNRKPVGVVEPAETRQYDDLYMEWKKKLNDQLRKANQTELAALSLS
jgi:xylulokinase